MSRRRCPDCQFFLPSRNYDDEGECRRNAPRRGPESAYATWPIVGLTHWCGEFRPRSDVQKETT